MISPGLDTSSWAPVPLEPWANCVVGIVGESHGKHLQNRDGHDKGGSLTHLFLAMLCDLVPSISNISNGNLKYLRLFGSLTS